MVSSEKINLIERNSIAYKFMLNKSNDEYANQSTSLVKVEGKSLLLIKIIFQFDRYNIFFCARRGKIKLIKNKTNSSIG